MPTIPDYAIITMVCLAGLSVLVALFCLCLARTHARSAVAAIRLVEQRSRSFDLQAVVIEKLNTLIRVNERQEMLALKRLAMDEARSEKEAS